MANCSAAVLARLARLTGLREAPYQVLHLATGYGDFPIAEDWECGECQGCAGLSGSVAFVRTRAVIAS